MASVAARPAAVIGVGLAVAGVVSTALATWCLLARPGLDVRVRAAYLVLAVSLGLGTFASVWGLFGTKAIW